MRTRNIHSTLNSITVFTTTGAGPAKLISGGPVTDDKYMHNFSIDFAADADDIDPSGADVS